MITLHWVHAVILIALFAAIVNFKIDADGCGAYGMPAMGCFGLLAAIILSLCLLLAKSWGWV